MDLWTGDLNYLAVIAAALVPMALGSWWYMPRVGLGGVWMRLVGTTEEEIRAQGGNQGLLMGSMLLSSLVLAYVLALLTRIAGASGFGQGLVLGLWLWAGVILTTSLGVYIFAGRGPRLWAFNNAYHLVSVPLMAGLLAAWT